MTAIVGVIQDGYVTIGGDSAGTSMHSLGSTLRGDPKVFVNGPYVMGFTSSFRMGQILQHSIRFTTPPTTRGNRPDNIDAHMVNVFISEVRKVLREQGWIQRDRDRDQGGTFLVGYQNLLYTIQGDFQIARSLDGYEAVGCGDSYALGALHAVEDLPLTPIERVTRGLKAAEHHNAGVRAPFNFVWTQPAR